MATKIKFNIFKFLFRLFSFLSDKTGGWMLFVKPKLLLGTLIVGLGVTACAPKENKTAVMPEPEIINYGVCYDVVFPTEDTIDAANKVYEIIDQMPQFRGGENALIAFLSKNVHYPDAALEQGIEGRVTCRFVVEKDGSVSRVEVLRKFDKECDNEAIRVIKSMPKWIPGKQKGEIVAAWFTLPITFRLPKPTN